MVHIPVTACCCSSVAPLLALPMRLAARVTAPQPKSTAAEPLTWPRWWPVVEPSPSAMRSVGWTSTRPTRCMAACAEPAAGLRMPNCRGSSSAPLLAG